MTEVRPLPQAPIRSHVEHDNRVSLRLNRAGSEQQNPICEGMKFRVKFSLSDATEVVSVARVTSYDSDGNSVNSYDIRALFTHDTTNLIAYADITAGTHTDSTADGIRNIVTISTTRRRWMTQSFWVADKPSDIVVVNGQVTTAVNPYVITVASIPYTISVPFSFFPSWNDEVGRQHYEGSVALGVNVVKPYGGAKTVEPLLGGVVIFNDVREVDVEDLHSLPLTFTADGQTQAIDFRFRAKRGSATYIIGTAYIKADLCDVDPIYTTITAAGETIYLPTAPELDPPPDPPTLPDEIVTSSSTNSTGEISVGVDSLGIDSNGDPETSVTLRLRGFKAGNRVFGTGTTPYAGEYVGYKEVVVNSIGSHVVALDPELEDSDIVIVEAEGSSGKISNAQIFRQSYTDIGTPSVPNVATLSYSFGTGPSGADVLSLAMTSAGWTGAEYYIAVKPYYAVIASGSTTAQDAADLGIEAGTAAQILGPYTGSHFANITWGSGTPDAVMVYMYNSLGSTVHAEHFSYDRNVTDYGIVKSGPVITSASLTTTTLTNDTLSVTVSSAGGNVGALDLKYYVVPQSAVSVATEKSPGTIPASAGTHTKKLVSGDTDIDGQYFVWVEGEQGSSSTLVINNLK